MEQIGRCWRRGWSGGVVQVRLIIAADWQQTLTLSMHKILAPLMQPLVSQCQWICETELFLYSFLRWENSKISVVWYPDIVYCSIFVIFSSFSALQGHHFSLPFSLNSQFYILAAGFGSLSPRRFSIFSHLLLTSPYFPGCPASLMFLGMFFLFSACTPLQVSVVGQGSKISSGDTFNTSKK